VTVLGSGNPNVHPKRAFPAHLVHLGEEPVLVDCGEGTVRQLARMGVSPLAINRIFVTHFHSDHVLGYPAFMLNRWMMSGQRGPEARPMDVYAPPGLRRMHELYFRDLFHQSDVAQRLAYGYREDLIFGHGLHEVGPGAVLDDGRLRVVAAEVRHPVYTLAYRFEHGGRVLVMGADSARSDALVDIARGADLLVADAMSVDPPAGFAADPHFARILEGIRSGHASPEEVGEMAAKAGVKKVLLTHLIGRWDLPDDDVIAQCARRYDGEIAVAHDFDRHDA
jgi:ribonuclease BN (tRNA processing enzyme)